MEGVGARRRAPDSSGASSTLPRVPRRKPGLVTMREQVETAKKIAPTRPHPQAPNSELFHKMIESGVGLMDRVRNKLTGRPTP